MPKPKTDILTIDEVASYLKVAERTVYRLAAARKIPAFKVGGAWRFSRTDITRWIRLQSSVDGKIDSSAAAESGRKA